LVWKCTSGNPEQFWQHHRAVWLDLQYGQIGRIFVDRAIVYFVNKCFWNDKSCPNFWATHSHSQGYALILDWATFWANFSQFQLVTLHHSSHPRPLWATPVRSIRIFFAFFVRSHIWGRCYDHNFLRFLPIFCEKIGVYLKNQCYDQIF
jgi:hypothetical protein